MRAVIQRVSRAEVISRVGEAGEVRGAIGPGLAVLIGFAAGDEPGVETWAADRVVGLRVFEDEAGKMNRDLRTIGGGVAAVPNFTLAADASKGRRPGFSGAMAPEEASERFDRFVAELRRLLCDDDANADADGRDASRKPVLPEPDTRAANGDPEVVADRVVAGVFGSHMHVDLINDGPITLVLER